MIYYNFITIILFFIIFILILKFKDFNIEKFQSNTTSSLDCTNITNNTKECNILRLMKDKRINDHISKLFRKSINEKSNTKNNNNNKNINDLLDKTFRNKENINKILEQINLLNHKTNNKYKDYINEKIYNDKYLLQKTNYRIQRNRDKSIIMDEFINDNETIKNRLVEYYDKIKEKANEFNSNSNIEYKSKSNPNNDNIIILQNLGNKMELNLINLGENNMIYKNLGNKMGLNRINLDENNMLYKNKDYKKQTYNLIINDTCVHFIDKDVYKYDNCNIQIDSLFTIDKIDNYMDYNKFIQYTSTDTTDNIGEYEISASDFPFYLICPLKDRGLCVTYENNALDENNLTTTTKAIPNNISFKPIRNNINQRFKIVDKSKFCSYK